MTALTPIREDPPLARLSAVFALVVALAACADTAPESEVAPAPDTAAEQPADDGTDAAASDAGADVEPEPEPDPLASLTPEARATREALLAAAAAGDWDAVGALIPTDTLFTSNYGGEDDHVAYYEGLEVDVLAETVALLEGDLVVLDDIAVWPAAYARVPFTVADDERAALEARFGAEALAGWEEAGSYLGWRIGITDAGEWIFLVEGD
jgi:hypothetical protein